MTTKPLKHTESYRDHLLESLKDHDEAARYLSACLEDNDPRVFLVALRDVADARGGVRTLATATGLNRESLYRILSEAGNPSLDTLSAVLTAFGLQLSIQGKPKSKRPRRQIA